MCCNISAHLATTANYIPSLTIWSVSYLRATSGLWKNRRAKDSLCISPGDNMSSLQETEEYPNLYLSYRNKKWEELYAPSIQLRRMPQCDNYRSAGMPASRWERQPPTNMTLVRLPHSASYDGSLLLHREFFSTIFPSPPKPTFDLNWFALIVNFSCQWPLLLLQRWND